jgi:hypothetical protein
MPTLGIRLHAEDVPRQDARFGRIERQARHRPFELFRIVPLGRAGVEQAVAARLRIEIFVHGGLRRGAERAVERQHFLLLDQAPRRLDAFRRAVASSMVRNLTLRPLMPPFSFSIWK